MKKATSVLSTYDFMNVCIRSTRHSSKTHFEDVHCN